MKLSGVQSGASAQTPRISGIKFNDGERVKQISKISEVEKSALSVSDKTVIEEIQKANKALERFAQTALEYSVHEKTRTIMIKIIDKETKEVIREIPPEKIQDMAAKLMELSGIIIDERR